MAAARRPPRRDDSSEASMRAITVLPGKADSAELGEVDEPPSSDGPVLVEALLLGVCGTDREIVQGKYGAAPPGHDRLVLGHESLGRVVEAPAGAGLDPGDLVAGIVRRPDPVPCSSCAVGEWDMCRNGRYTERGIKELDGYGSERWRLQPEFAVRIDPALGHLGVLVEPASVLTKAWEHVERIGRRAHWEPRRALVTGAGPIGLLAALLAVQRGLEVHVLDQLTEGPKPQLVADLGASYHTGPPAEACSDADVIVECTGVGSLVFDVISCNAPGGVVCLTGISSGGREVPLDATGVNRRLVLENDVVFGSVNANRRHYQDAAAALARADRSWLERLVTRRVPLERWTEALERRPDDVKVTVQFGG
jgi:threonine dehydrogenase-like Zn-dependent dehydrogenase